MIILVTVVSCGEEAQGQEAATQVFLNGVATPVHFNDGDSFRVLAGKFQGSRARLVGFNTLESFGPVHVWGDWHPQELYVVAKQATLNARKGIWHCHSKDLSKDGYGRILWSCPDLAVDQVRKGLAHAMTITSDPAPPGLLKAQYEAIAAKRGIWARGVPTYIVTSLHSTAEGRSDTADRLISTADGHSEMAHHSHNYDVCERVCHYGPKGKVPSCHIYVPSKRRFGRTKANCLKLQ